MSRASVFATVACAAIGLLSAVGLTACNPVPARLTCSAVPSPAKPLQDTTETIAVRTGSGARVTTEAAYRTVTTRGSALANSAGRASVVYQVGKALSGFPVKVSVVAIKGSQRALCATTFTPEALAKPRVTVTTALDRSIRLAWGDASAAVTGYQVSIVTDLGKIHSWAYSAATTSTAVLFNGPLANACDPSTFKDGVTVSVTAVSKTASSETAVVSKHMPRAVPAQPTGLSVALAAAPNQVTIKANFECPVVKWGFIRSTPQAYTSVPGRSPVGAGGKATVAVDKGIYQSFSIQQCASASGPCSDVKTTSGLSVSGLAYQPVSPVGVCDPGGQFIDWSWSAGRELAFDPQYVVTASSGWSGGTTTAGSTTFRSVFSGAPAAFAGSHQVSIRAKSNDLLGVPDDPTAVTPLTATVSCPAPVTASPAPSVSASVPPSASVSPTVSPSASVLSSNSPAPSAGMSASASATPNVTP